MLATTVHRQPRHGRPYLPISSQSLPITCLALSYKRGQFRAAVVWHSFLLVSCSQSPEVPPEFLCCSLGSSSVFPGIKRRFPGSGVVPIALVAFPWLLSCDVHIASVVSPWLLWYSHYCYNVPMEPWCSHGSWGVLGDPVVSPRPLVVFPILLWCSHDPFGVSTPAAAFLWLHGVPWFLWWSHDSKGVPAALKVFPKLLWCSLAFCSIAQASVVSAGLRRRSYDSPMVFPTL